MSSGPALFGVLRVRDPFLLLDADSLLDLVRVCDTQTNLQLQPSGAATTASVVRAIVQKCGVIGLWRGMGPAAVSKPPPPPPFSPSRSPWGPELARHGPTCLPEDFGRASRPLCHSAVAGAPHTSPLLTESPLPSLTCAAPSIDPHSIAVCHVRHG